MSRCDAVKCFIVVCWPTITFAHTRGSETGGVEMILRTVETVHLQVLLLLLTRASSYHSIILLDTAPAKNVSTHHARTIMHMFRFFQSNVQELKMQRMMLSPRALQQGWKEELDNNIGQHRDWITKRKLEAVFNASFPARKLEEEVLLFGLGIAKGFLLALRIAKMKCFADPKDAIRKHGTNSQNVATRILFYHTFPRESSVWRVLLF